MLSTKISKIIRPICDLKVVYLEDNISHIAKAFIDSDTDQEMSKILAVSNGNDIIGILSVGDLLKSAKYLMRSFSHDEIRRMSTISNYGQLGKVLEIEEEMKKGTSLKVEDIMIRRTPRIKPNDSISKAFDFLLESNLRVLPVYNEREQVVGIIRDVDLLECLIDYID